mgnify:CR=1 FL=1
MKVLLINPPELHPVQANLPPAVERLRGATPPIGLMYVAAAARATGEHQVALLDAHAERLDYPALARRVREASPEVVGLTATTFTLLDARKTARTVRETAPAATIVCGGLQPFLYPRETMRLGVFDVCLQGEADHTFPQLLSALVAGNDPARIPGVVLSRDGEVVSQDPPPPVADLDALPFAAHDLTPIARYSSLVTERAPVGIMLSSRGCPFRCAFCSQSVTGKVHRRRSPKNIVEEMVWCDALGLRYILFYDELMTIEKAHTLALCAAIRERRLDLPWLARSRVGTVDGETMREMKRAGCDTITMGIEAGSPRVLQRLNRPTDLKATIELFRQARRAGLRTIAYFMIGNPDETWDDVRASLAVARQAAPDMVHASLYTPYPATELYAQGLRTGLFADDYWRTFSAAPDEKFRTRLWCAPGDEPRLLQRLRWFYRRYYLRPAYIIRRLRALRSWRDLRAHLRGLRTVLSLGER